MKLGSIKLNSKTTGIVFLFVCLLIVLFIGQWVYLGGSMYSIREGATGKKPDAKKPDAKKPDAKKPDAAKPSAQVARPQAAQAARPTYKPKVTDKSKK